MDDQYDTDRRSSQVQGYCKRCCKCLDTVYRTGTSGTDDSSSLDTDSSGLSLDDDDYSDAEPRVGLEAGTFLPETKSENREHLNLGPETVLGDKEHTRPEPGTERRGEHSNPGLGTAVERDGAPTDKSGISDSKQQPDVPNQKGDAKEESDLRASVMTGAPGEEQVHDQAQKTYRSASEPRKAKVSGRVGSQSKSRNPTKTASRTQISNSSPARQVKKHIWRKKRV